MEASDQGRVALVTGAGGGIGSAVAAAFAARGYHVLAGGRDAERAAVIAAELSAVVPDGQFTPIAGDVTSQDSVAAMFGQIRDTVGRLDSFVHCATARPGPRSGAPIRHNRFADLDPATFGTLLGAPLVPLYTLCHHAVRLLKSSGGGAIVTYASDAGKVALPNQVVTGTLMAAVMMFTRTLAMEVAGDHIRVNCVSPTYVADTPIFDRVMAVGENNRAATAMRRAKLGLPVPRELAELSAFLCSDGAAHLTGQVISVSGGLSAA